MRRQLLTATSDNTFLAIDCPEGKQIRIVNALLLVASATSGSSMALRFSRGSAELAFAMSGALGSACVGVNWALGFDTQDASIETIDPVTGNVNLNSTQTVLNAPLPDVWWDWPILILPIGIGPQFSVLTVTYELQEKE